MTLGKQYSNLVKRSIDLHKAYMMRQVRMEYSEPSLLMDFLLVDYIAIFFNLLIILFM